MRSDVEINFDGDLCIRNGWDTGDGVVRSGGGGAAMIVDEMSVRHRYRCNGGYPDDDFDDLVFRIERLEGVGEPPRPIQREEGRAGRPEGDRPAS